MGPILMMPAPSFMLAHSSVKCVSCGCHGDVKAEALRHWQCPGHQAGPVLRPEDGGGAGRALARSKGTRIWLSSLPPGLLLTQAPTECPASYRGTAAAHTWLPGFLQPHLSMATDSNQTSRRRKAAVISVSCGQPRNQPLVRFSSLTSWCNSWMCTSFVT